MRYENLVVVFVISMGAIVLRMKQCGQAAGDYGRNALDDQVGARCRKLSKQGGRAEGGGRDSLQGLDYDSSNFLVLALNLIIVGEWNDASIPEERWYCR